MHVRHGVDINVAVIFLKWQISGQCHHPLRGRPRAGQLPPDRARLELHRPHVSAAERDPRGHLEISSTGDTIDRVPQYMAN